ncbi:(2Fe-2S)-binding protein [Massilia sp. TWR1-2-2]|uniref:(2Fe-2S)-binding protein n=1 Tax=Massilia sp. TWR1-2-2 TaxID=2804584 RepID=UPI003CFA209D
MSAAIKLTVNGKPQNIAAAPDTPLLYVLRNDLGVTGPRFGCGLAQCGACTVHVDGAAVRSCVTPVAAVAGKRIVTLEGLAATAPAGAALHLVQQAFIDEQAAQCGYCINGWIMTSAALLKAKPNASDAELREGLAGLKCRCGTHMSILRAVKRAAIELAKG